MIVNDKNEKIACRMLPRNILPKTLEAIYHSHFLIKIFQQHTTTISINPSAFN